MQTKLSKLKDAAAANDWRTAIAIAVKFQRLGIHKEAITRAHMAYTNPRFLAQVGKDVDTCIDLGKQALVAAYSLEH